MRKSLLLALCLPAGTAFAQHISEFTSVNPVDIQDQYITLPETHAFQLLFQFQDPLTEGGTVGRWSDFTGYVPVDGSSTEGHLCVNSEFVPGGVSVHDMTLNPETQLWEISSSGAVDFSAFNCLVAGGTVANCSGGITPWGTMVTCEENVESFICNYEGYRNFGWNIEIDPVTRTVIDQNSDGTPDKLWAMGRMKHENVCFTMDSTASYYADDNSTSGYVFKFVMHQKANLASGDLYVYKLDFTTMSGEWVLVPNTSKSDRNNTIDICAGLGATPFDRVEDVEIGTMDDKVYFASTGANRVYRMNQDGTDFEIFVDNVDFDIDFGSGTKSVRFSSPDNLVFDDLGNMWVNQDGGNNYFWVIGPDHTAASPKVRVFANTPAGCESTGTTFTPDFKYMFVSIQHPDVSNSEVQLDVADQNVTFDRDATLVVARKEHLGIASTSINEQTEIFIAPKTYTDRDGLLTITFSSLMHGKAEVQVLDMNGSIVRNMNVPVHVGLNQLRMDLRGTAAGTYVTTLSMNGKGFSNKFVR